ncbi:MAG: AMP-binding protein [Nocardioidaceae bacterium]
MTSAPDKLPLNLRHLLWRMEHVNASAEVAGAGSPGDDHAVRRRTFADTAGRIARLSSGLARLGIGPGDTVCTLAWNTPEHFEALLAVPCMGATLNNINLRLPPDVLDDLVAEPSPSLVVVDAGLLGDGELARTSRTVIDRQARAGTPIAVIGDADVRAGLDLIGFEDLLDDPPTATLGGADIAEDSTAFLFHSGGTTGRPKTYEVTHRAALLHALSQATVDATGLSRGDRALPLAPFFHVNGWGLPLTAALTGTSLVLPGRDMGADRLARLIRDERVTVAAGVPTIWHDVCAAVAADPGLRPRDLREVLSGGSPVPLSIVDDVRKLLGASVATAWGMTETMACSTYEREAPQDSAGRPIPLVELRVRGEAGDAATRSRLGRLDVRGPFVVAEPTDPDGSWFSTGDIAVIDAEGRLSLKDREKDLIKSGGEWIASAVLEQHLCTHEGVASAAVVPTHHPRWIERPVAYVVLHPGSARRPDAEQLREHLARSVPRWWLPDCIHIVDELPRTSVGKIDKRAVRTQAHGQHTQSSGGHDDER